MNTKLTKHLISSLKIGEKYSTENIAFLISRSPEFIKQRGGVINTSGDNYLILLITLKKKNSAIQYADSIHGNILSWEAPKKQKFAEKRIEDINTNIFIFVRNQPSSKYYFLGRGLPIRKQILPYGLSSKIQFNLYELKNSCCYDLFSTTCIDQIYKNEEINSNKNIVKTIKNQYIYKEQAFTIWGKRCAITGINDTNILLTSHIKPWNESNNNEKLDPKNSIILSPNYEKLFNLGFITFNPSSGKIRLSDKLNNNYYDKLNINANSKLIYIPDNTDKYLEYHNYYIYNFIPSQQSVFDNLII